MILKTCFLLMLSVAWEVSGASFSKVFVQTGPEVAPSVEYLPYGAYGASSFSYANPQIAQYVAAPVVGLEYPYASGYNYGVQCTTTSCFYPEHTVAPVAPVAPSANIVQYISPALSEKIESVPMVYSSGHNVPGGYEYEYVIVDDNTGDHRVHSDGGVVRGEYAFLQPEGLLHELQYVADDVKGFNAVVNVLPHEHSKSAIPCDVHSEALTELESHDEHHEEAHEDHEEHEARHGAHEGHVDEVHGEEKSHQEETQEHHESHEHNEKGEENDKGHEVEPEKLTHDLKAHESHDHENHDHENHDHDGHTHEKLIEGSHHHAEPHEHGEHEHHESHHHTHHLATGEHDLGNSNVYVSYNDVIKCIQAAMAKVNTHHPSIPRAQSPLTYLIFNKPC